MTNQQDKTPWAKKEEEILSYWKKENIFEKSLENTKNGEVYTFYDGPPFATGLPHYGHLLPGTVKDIIPRYQTMKGRYVRRQWGWDCHGLPVENIVEKELGLKSKKDINTFGIEKFNEAARETVLRYEHEWLATIPRTGRFVDMSHPYMTMQSRYTESVWWAFKTLYDKGLVFEGFKSMHLCPRCETTLSNFEVAQGYKDMTDISVFVLFALKDIPDTYITAWTTTPWTLPGNVALAVNPEVTYSHIQIQTAPEQQSFLVGKNIVLAKERLSVLEGFTYTTTKEVLGSELVGLSYTPVFPYYASDTSLLNHAHGWKIYGADFVTVTDGTGVVHIAPAFGSDDYELSKKEKLPFIQHVSIQGVFKPEVTDFAGQSVKPKSEEKDGHQVTDINIIKYLAAHNSLLGKKKLVHSYPTCWRCDTPLLNYATSSWFVKVSDPAFKKQILEANKKVNWTPEHIKEGRFGNWLEGAPDWAVSRSRFWGAPLPVWRSEDGKETVVIATREDIRKHSSAKNEYFVMRHGESVNNVKGIISRDPQGIYPLTEAGVAQVTESIEAAQKAGIEMIVASPILRTKQTAEIVSKALGVDVIYDERLLEVSPGVFEGKSAQEWHASFKAGDDRFQVGSEKGEAFKDVQKRAGDILYDLETKYTGKKILFITHDCVAWLMTAVARGWNQEEAIEQRGSDLMFLKNAQVKELSFKPMPHNGWYELDMHRPYIDAITLTSPKGTTLKRIPEVFDCWFESGAMPFAQQYYTGTPTKDFDPEKNIGYPADFIAESLDQTRGWFYTLLILGVGLFGKSPYTSVVCNGLILAEDGRKMSKRLKNYPELDYVFDKYGADALRMYIMSQPVVRGEEMRFSEKGVDEVYKKVILRLQNSVSLLEMYGGVTEVITDIQKRKLSVLEQWMMVRLAETQGILEKAFDTFDINTACRAVDGIVDDLSTWYLRRMRDEIRTNPEARNIAGYVLRQLSLLIAPLIPFSAEDIWKRTGGVDSVHMASWPQKAGAVDTSIFESMKQVRSLVSAALDLRVKAGIKVRQPLASLTLTTELSKEYTDIIADEVNVLSVTFGNEMKLDTNLTDELKAQGLIREVMRNIQEARKQAGAKPDELKAITLTVLAQDQKTIQAAIEEIQKETTTLINIVIGETAGVKVV